VRARGWRFELDYERIRESDTWALAPPELRPWLLMLWLTAWQQEPCGTLPAADDVVAARIGMPMRAFTKHRATLMRGWWLAEDGRQYHDTIAKRVLEMLAAKDKERNRKAAYRQRMDAERLAASRAVTEMSHGTDEGQPGDSHGSDPGRDDTGTGTGTGTYTQEQPPPPDLRPGLVGADRQSPTKAGIVCVAIRARGIAGVNPSSPLLLELIGKGVPIEVFEAAAKTCAEAKPPKGMAYLLGIVKRQLAEAAGIAAGPGMPAKAWDATRSSIEAMGVELGLGQWDEADLSADRETFEVYTERVRRRMAAQGQAA
jgi:hypothetical protein